MTIAMKSRMQNSAARKITPALRHKTVKSGIGSRSLDQIAAHDCRGFGVRAARFQRDPLYDWAQFERHAISNREALIASSPMQFRERGSGDRVFA
jgi:hypothetical protein